MVLLTFGEQRNAGVMVDGRRWALELTTSYIGLREQVLWHGRWIGGGRYYLLAWSRRWGLRRQHCNYDGPNDGLIIGPLQLWWAGRWCERCAEGR